ncbi:MAG TPA: hypothetical protein VJP80_02225 [Candidatus Saccharimonadales bacterium]|nr:hypothetical protein [Candidatus Saccharimonadales bacterium]
MSKSHQPSGHRETSPGFVDSLLPIRDADVADIPSLFHAADDRMRELAVRFHEHGPADDPLLNLLAEKLHEGYPFDVGGRFDYRAGKLFATIVAERKYRQRFEIHMPPFGPTEVDAGHHAVDVSRAYAAELPNLSFEERVLAQELHFLGSDAVDTVYEAIAAPVRTHLLQSYGIDKEVDAQALHLGMVEGLVFYDACLGATWGEAEPREFTDVQLSRQLHRETAGALVLAGVLATEDGLFTNAPQ